MFCLKKKGYYLTKKGVWVSELELEEIWWFEIYVTASQEAMKIDAEVIPMLQITIMLRDSLLQERGFVVSNPSSSAQSFDEKS